ncbi:MAG TPA: response regulator transcription factor [Acidisarcina sp.]
MSVPIVPSQSLLPQDSFWAGATIAPVQPWPGSALRRVLVVERDLAMTKFLARGLAGQNFSVDSVSEIQTALDLIAGPAHDLVLLDMDLLDIGLPGELPSTPDAQPAGVTFLKLMTRTQPQVPVMVLSGNRRTEDLVKVLEAGADDFLMKPFSFVELVARIRTVLRRTSNRVSEEKKERGLRVNVPEFKVERNGRSIELTRREFAILETLLNHAGRPVSRELLMEEVWKAPLNAASNIVDVYMKYLRDKIDLPGEVKLIRTIRGVGYALVEG